MAPGKKEKKPTKKIDPNLIVQSNKLIVNRKHMSRGETRLYLMVLSRLTQENADLEFDIPVQDFCDIWNTDIPSSYSRLRGVAESIAKRGVTIEYVDDRDRQRFTVIPLFAYIRYIDGEAKINCRINPSLKPCLLDLKSNFTKYRFQNIIELDRAGASSDTVRLYELCHMWAFKGEHTCTLDDIRDMMDLYDRDDSADDFQLVIEDFSPDGITRKRLNPKYPQRKEFKRRILDPAVETINATTDLTVSYKFSGRGSATTITFTIEDHSEKGKDTQEEQENGQETGSESAEDSENAEDAEDVLNDDPAFSVDLVESFRQTIEAAAECEFSDSEIDFFIQRAKIYLGPAAIDGDEYFAITNYFAQVRDQFLKQRADIKKPEAWLRTVLVDGLKQRN